MTDLATDVLIAGGGPAGISAAIAAASSGSSVVLVDDNPSLGGQIWRAELSKRSPKAREILDSLASQKISILSGTSIFDIETGGAADAVTPSGRLAIRFRDLVIATGARERSVPFPGWTLPNIFGAAGLQALVKGGFDIKGRRIVVAGSGPLLLVVAAYLREKGGNVLAVVEQTPSAKLAAFGLRLIANPKKAAEGVRLKNSLRGVPFSTGSWVTSAGGDDKLEYVQVSRKGRPVRFDCDILACGFHLVPNIELAALIGCEIIDGLVQVDALQQTTIPNVYCAGEPTGIGGVDASLVEGRIAGLAAAGRVSEAESYFARRAKTSAFAKLLDRTFAPRNELRSLADDPTVVCRCEDVELGRLKAFRDWREAKLQTRCGMGPCQGRVCGPATKFLFGWQPSSVRPPIFPVKLGEL